MSEKKWKFAVDRGGTFTDIVAFAPDGSIRTLKLLSQSPHYKDACVEGIRRIVGPGEQIEVVRIGTTLGTNALLEKKGVPVCLVASHGFGDVLEIGYQDRPHLFELDIQKPALLYQKVVEVDGRMDARGNTITPLDREQAQGELRKVYEAGVRSLAILLLHSWKNPEHEQAIFAIAREIGFPHIACSSSVMPLVKVVGRGRTTVVDAYITPILQSYLDEVAGSLPGIPLKCMQSNGGIVDASCFRGRDAILSGPAGGAIGFSHVAGRGGYPKAIGFDMGGTSTDVSRFDGKHEKVFEAEVASIRFQADMLNVVSVAAGGGSILKFDGQKMAVGPESAGAIPGPACYRAGGPLTITDANLFLGRIVPRFFPKVFGKSADEGLDFEGSAHKFGELARQIARDTGVAMTPEEAAQGFIRIADHNMGEAIKKVSVARGFHPRDYALVCFGGAGAQHACAIARSLGISTILIPPLAGVLSAYGIAIADTVRTAVKSVLVPFTEKSCSELQGLFADLESPLREAIVAEGVKRVASERCLDVRPKGTEAWEVVPYGPFGEMREEFYRRYFRHYGMRLPVEKELEAVNIRVDVIGREDRPAVAAESLDEKRLGRPDAINAEHRVYFFGEFRRCPIFSRSALRPGYRVSGPAVIVEANSTAVLEPGFEATVDGYGNLVLSRVSSLPKERVTAQKDPVFLEVFHNIFRGAAEQMGVTLLNTAHSTNIKERMDFSCAVFDPAGNLVANAPHIPVHLGAMGETVRRLIRARGSGMAPGEVYASNNPFAGGSHLPDITVVTPVFDPERKPIFLVAARGHHADIGGITPGSMPPFSKTIAEEGVLLDDFLLVSQGRFREEETIAALSCGPYPARNLSERLSDLRAQIAANNRGVQVLNDVVAEYGIEVVVAYMRHIQENAALAMKKALGKFIESDPRVTRSFYDYLDDGSRIEVAITIERGEDPPHSHRAIIDFAGTSAQMAGNLNAPAAVTQAAVLYVLRTLIEEDIPLNSGCLDPVVISIPETSLLNPKFPAAVAGGNVETSQRIVDVLCGALGVAAASQGTMNNWTFGTEGSGGFGYYETICGGAGAGPGFPGANAVHTHMTNTRITDTEVLEHRYPEVRVEEFSIRRGSGGAGAFRGGDGVVRRIRFLEPRTVTILSERRATAPYGLKGGKRGKRGLNTLTRNSGEQSLPAKVSLVISAGEILTIYTPGGGGFGPA